MDDRAEYVAAPWRTGDAYVYLHRVERRMFAWEWLRRTPGYQATWVAAREIDPVAQEVIARSFGLAALVDPARDSAVARSIWLEGHDRRVVAARITTGEAPADRLDVRRFGPGAATMVVGTTGVEHRRLGGAGASVRLDVIGGTLLGAPSPLAYEVAGLARAKPKLDALGILLQLVAAPQRKSSAGQVRLRVSR